MEALLNTRAMEEGVEEVDGHRRVQPRGTLPLAIRVDCRRERYDLIACQLDCAGARDVQAPVGHFNEGGRVELLGQRAIHCVEGVPQRECSIAAQPVAKYPHASTI